MRQFSNLCQVVNPGLIGNFQRHGTGHLGFASERLDEMISLSTAHRQLEAQVFLVKALNTVTKT